MKNIAQKEEISRIPTIGSEFEKQVKADKLFCVRAFDDEFKHLGINADDLVIYRLADSYDEEQLTIWESTSKSKKQFLDFGFAFENFGDISLSDGDGRFARYKKTHMRLVGEIVGILKSFDARNPNLQPKEPEEIIAVCGKCKKETTGTPEFIKSQGWELEENEALCLTCDLYGGGK